MSEASETKADPRTTYVRGWILGYVNRPELTLEAAKVEYPDHDPEILLDAILDGKEADTKSLLHNVGQNQGLARMALKGVGAVCEKKEDRFGDTKSGWWMDGVFLDTTNRPIGALHALYGC